MTRTKSTFLALIAVLLSPMAANADLINIDFRDFSGTPPSTFGAASGQTGVWNNVRSSGALSLLDLSGAASGVGLSITGSGGASGRGTAAPADVAALLNDGIRMDADVLALTFSGLEAGLYNVFTYALNSSFLDDGATVSVLGSADAAQSINGVWGGAFVFGTNYSLHGLSLAAGADLTLNVTAISGATAARIAGIQLVRATPVPEPGTLALLGIGLLGMAASRRRKKA